MAQSGHVHLPPKNSYQMMNKEIIPGKKKQRSMVSSIICDLDTLSSNVNVVSRAGVAKAERRGWPLVGAAHSISQS